MDSKQTIYYGVYIPNDIQVQDNEGSRNVFFDKLEALKEVKKYKKARFKVFQFYHEALEFALHGSEFPNNNSTLEINTSKNNDGAASPSVGEKPSQFRGPKSQDLVKLRKAIESGDVHFVRTTIWENPRYLISSGDTPAILQEGARYNALHVAAKAKNAEMAELILSTVGSPEFLQLLYGEENRVNSEEGAKILLDLYLNTPDKGLNETPLHFAVKYGAAEVVEVLVSYPQCDKEVLNKYGNKPKEMICTRATDSSKALMDKIAALLDDRFYVPVFRSEDNCIQPMIGEPFSPNSPPQINTNPISPRLEIHAYAGPMKKEEASLFRKKWKTPPRTPNNPSTPLKKTPIRTPKLNNSELGFRLQDTEKGLERVGRDLAKKFNVGWREYWPFLGTFTDLTSNEGLGHLESFLKTRYSTAYSESVSNSINKQMIDNNSTNSMNIMSYSTVTSPMSELCKNFEACTLNDSSTPKIERTQKHQHQTNKNDNNVFDYLTKVATCPCLCIEKSCQVFATRISHQILYQMDSVSVHTVDALESEIKHLKSLIASFMDDPAFINVINFQSVHSRISYIIASKLKQTIFDEELDVKIQNLEKIIQKYDKMVDLFSSDDEDLNNCSQQIKFVRRKSTSDCKQVICLVEQILKSLESLECVNENEYLNANVEEQCLKIWASAVPCSCVWKTNKTLRKSASLKKNNINKFAASKKLNQFSRSVDSVSRRLNFHDDVDNELDEIIDGNQSFKDNINTSTSSSSSEYESANSSKYSSDVEDSNEELFEDVENDDFNVFIEGNIPTKIDYAVYNATKDVPITSEQYPNIYRWRHSITTFPEEERISWPSPSTPRFNLNRFNINRYACALSTPSPRDLKKNLFASSPQQSWMRITGQNSPLKSLKALKDSISLPYEDNIPNL